MQSGKGTDIKPLKKGSNYAKWFRESANENSQKHTAGAEPNRPSCHSVVGVVRNINSPVSNIALQWEKIAQKAASLATSHASAGVEPGDKLDSSEPILCYTTLQFARKYFAKLYLIHGEKTKVVKAQIDSASTCNTIPSSLLRNLFPNAEIRRTRGKINRYGSETLRPEGQVTLCWERRGRIHTIDFLVVNVPDGKPALLSGRDALNYLKVYTNETQT